MFCFLNIKFRLLFGRTVAAVTYTKVANLIAINHTLFGRRKEMPDSPRQFWASEEKEKEKKIILHTAGAAPQL
uniref:Putative secreted protein n=1 Tax=Anopheles darlingi TaxID=43151 RepID=A0A2M4D1F1_ANODA